MYRELLGDGSELEFRFSYKIQEKPNGIAEAFKIGEEFIDNDDVCLILVITYSMELILHIFQKNFLNRLRWSSIHL